MQAMRQWNNIVKVVKKICQLRILYPAKPSFTIKARVKIFPDNQSNVLLVNISYKEY